MISNRNQAHFVQEVTQALQEQVTNTLNSACTVTKESIIE